MTNTPDNEDLDKALDKFANYFAAGVSAHLSHAAGDVAGLVERLQAGVPTEPGCSHPIWSDVEKADATMAEAATTISALSARTEAAEARSERFANHCQSLVAEIEHLQEATGETLDDEDAAMVEHIDQESKVFLAARSLSIKEAGNGN
jgi:hypothetical protein